MKAGIFDSLGFSVEENLILASADPTHGEKRRQVYTVPKHVPVKSTMEVMMTTEENATLYMSNVSTEITACSLQNRYLYIINNY